MECCACGNDEMFFKAPDRPDHSVCGVCTALVKEIASTDSCLPTPVKERKSGPGSKSIDSLRLRLENIRVESQSPPAEPQVPPVSEFEPASTEGGDRSEFCALPHHKVHHDAAEGSPGTVVLDSDSHAVKCCPYLVEGAMPPTDNSSACSVGVVVDSAQPDQEVEPHTVGRTSESAAAIECTVAKVQADLGTTSGMQVTDLPKPLQEAVPEVVEQPILVEVSEVAEVREQEDVDEDNVDCPSQRREDSIAVSPCTSHLSVSAPAALSGVAVHSDDPSDPAASSALSVSSEHTAEQALIPDTDDPTTPAVLSVLADSLSEHAADQEFLLEADDLSVPAAAEQEYVHNDDSFPPSTSSGQEASFSGPISEQGVHADDPSVPQTPSGLTSNFPDPTVQEGLEQGLAHNATDSSAPSTFSSLTSDFTEPTVQEGLGQGLAHNAADSSAPSTFSSLTSDFTEPSVQEGLEQGLAHNATFSSAPSTSSILPSSEPIAERGLTQGAGYNADTPSIPSTPSGLAFSSTEPITEQGLIHNADDHSAVKEPATVAMSSFEPTTEQGLVHNSDCPSVRSVPSDLTVPSSEPAAEQGSIPTSDFPSTPAASSSEPASEQGSIPTSDFPSTPAASSSELASEQELLYNADNGASSTSEMVHSEPECSPALTPGNVAGQQPSPEYQIMSDLSPIAVEESPNQEPPTAAVVTDVLPSYESIRESNENIEITEEHPFVVQMKQRIIEEAESQHKQVLKDFEDLQQRYSTLWTDFRNLEAMMEELMTAYDKSIDATHRMEKDHLSRDELREHEIAQFREAAKDSAAKLERANASNTELNAQIVALKRSESAAKHEAQRLQFEIRNTQQMLTRLKEQAERKLKGAHAKYVAAQEELEASQSSLKRTRAAVDELNVEYASLKASQDLKSKQCSELSERISALVQAVREKEEQAETAARRLMSVQRQLNAANTENSELKSKNERFMNSLVEANNEIRSLRERVVDAEHWKSSNAQMTAVVEKLKHDNNLLKSRIFDQIEAEKCLRAQLQASQNGPMTAPGNSPELEQAIAERDEQIAALQKTIDAKHQENKELMQISEELLRKLEGGKA